MPYARHKDIFCRFRKRNYPLFTLQHNFVVPSHAALHTFFPVSVYTNPSYPNLSSLLDLWFCFLSWIFLNFLNVKQQIINQYINQSKCTFSINLGFDIANLSALGTTEIECIRIGKTIILKRIENSDQRYFR